MSCRKSKDVLLYFYNELPDDDRASMEAHLHACVPCRLELEALQHMRAATPTPSIDDQVLLPTRRALFYKLRHWQSNPPQARSPRLHVGKLTLQAGLAAALIFFGFWLGEKKQSQRAQPSFSISDLITASKTVAVQGDAISPYLIGINKITLNAQDGTIEIKYNTLNDITVRGSGDDPIVKLMLQTAMQMDEAPSMRLRAVKAVKHIASTQGTLDDSFIEALGRILAQDKSIGIKLSALQALQPAIDSPRAKQLLIKSILMDEEKAIRIQAFKTLLQSKEPISEMTSILSTTKSDSNAYIRTKSLKLLKQGKDALL